MVAPSPDLTSQAAIRWIRRFRSIAAALLLVVYAWVVCYAGEWWHRPLPDALLWVLLGVAGAILVLQSFVMLRYFGIFQTLA
jgi:hypothetical protein